MHCAPAGHAPRSVSAPMISQSRCCWGTAVSEITGIAHRSGGRVGDGFALFPPVSPGLALSRDTHSFCDDLAGGENSLWGGSFHLRSSQHLPRCRWGGAVAVLADGLDGKIKTGDPLSSFPIRSSVRCNALCSRRARSEECVRAYEISRSRCCWGTAASEITGIAHRSGGRVGDGFALFPPVFPRSSALPGRKPKL